jgi:4-hydroxybutyryl-CoA dehydratase/vinylacetyl-CoA-Delta-isomerase
MSTENPMRIFRLIENLILGAAAVDYLARIHTRCRISAAQRIIISLQVDMNQRQTSGKRQEQQ